MLKNRLAVECLLFYPLMKHDSVSLETIMSKLYEFRKQHDLSELWAPFDRRAVVEAYQTYSKRIAMEWVKGTKTTESGWVFIKKDPDNQIFNEEWCDKTFMEPWLDESMIKAFKTMFM